ncbi:uncharacterized protein LOC120357339 [Solenopsis invicta]|uniref:uncharacterized protein LOC120357339 n=1 Tax=Solenopsis invicta TaxID=13686 RepID=UPI00193E0C70|nr:uncharacterized protein LOC120357339 [Solenopsis invicta]
MGGRVKLGEEKVYSLSYADDTVLLAEEEDDMRSILVRLERYLDGKGLELNVSKTRIMRFRKGGEEKESDLEMERKGNRRGKRILLLGLRSARQWRAGGTSEGKVKERSSNNGKSGKRRFKGDWGRLCWLFDMLVWSVIGYRVEIWGWKEREALERLQERFLKWVMGVNWGTPRYMVREEIQRGKLRERAGIRAIGFEKRLEEGRGSELVKKC